MKDRGMMKWQPFTSIIEQGSIVLELLEEQSRMEKPKLDQWKHEENARHILLAYHSHQEIQLVYYEGGHLQHVKGKVYGINEAYRYVMMKGEQIQKKVSFDQIIEVLTEW